MSDKEHTVSQTLTRTVSLETTEDKKNILVFCDGFMIANFKVQKVWDMLINTVANLDVSPEEEPDLFKRKGEALAGLLHTHKVVSKLGGGGTFVPVNKGENREYD